MSGIPDHIVIEDQRQAIEHLARENYRLTRMAEARAQQPDWEKLWAEVSAERDARLEDLGIIIMALPSGTGMRSLGAVDGVKALRAERDALKAEVEKWQKAFAAQSRKLQSVLDIPGARAALQSTGETET